MVAASFLPMSLEQDLLSRKKIAQDQINQGRATDLGTIARLTGIQQKWGWLPPSMQLGFAQAGFHMDSAEVRDTAQLELRRRARVQQVTKDLQGISSVADLHRAVAKGETQGLPHDALMALGRQATQPHDDGGSFVGSVLDDLPVVGSVKALVEGKGVQEALTRAIPGEHLVSQGYSALGSEVGDATKGTPVAGAGDVAKGVTREVGAAANTPLQFVQGLVRNKAQAFSNLAQGDMSLSNVARAADPTLASNEISAVAQVARGQNASPYLQTDVGQQVKALANDQSASLGAGWLPDPKSPIAQAQAQASREAAPTIGGHAFTLGRGVAAGLNEIVPGQVLEPDTFGFNLVSGLVDAGVAMKADPTATGLQAFSEARAASRIYSPENALNAAGAYQGARKFLGIGHGPTPEKWMESPQGNKVINGMAAEPSASRLVRDYKLPATAVDGTPIAARVAAESDPEAIKAILRPYLGPDVHNVITQPGGFAYGVKQGISGLSPTSATAERTLTGIMPDRWIDPQDKNATWKSVDGWLQTGNVPQSVRDKVLDKYLNAQGPDQTFQALTVASDAVKESLIKHGMGEQRANQLSKLFPDAAEQERLYGVDQATRGELARNSGVVIDGVGHQSPSPLLTTEALNSLIELPDMRELRRATSVGAKLFDSTPWKVTTGALDSFIGFWRNAHLLRPGLGPHIVGDSQLSLAANGYDSLFTHPLNTVSAIIGGNLDKHWAQWAQAHIPGVHGNLTFDALNAPMISSYDDVERAIHGGWTALEDPTKVALAGFHAVNRGHGQYAQGLADELVRLGGDPRVRGLLSQESPEAAKAWFWSGEGAALREKGIPLANDINEANKARALTLGGGAYAVPLDLESRPGADAFVDDIFNRVHSVTGGDATLRDAILTGKVGDTAIRSGRLGVTNQGALDRIEQMSADGLGPDVVKARDMATLTRAAASRDRALKTQVLRSLFDHMVMLPDADLDRIPAYQQAYWKRASEYLPYLDTTPVRVGGQMTTLRDVVLQRASENLPERSVFSDVSGAKAQDFLDNLRNAPIDTGARKLNLDQFHQLTKSAALDEIPRLVHDLSTRSQFFDMTRLLFPFGDAFRRIMQRWVTNAWEHPSTLRRAQQGITAARETGFFHVDPTTGQEVFTYTGSGWLTDKLIGVPVPLTGQVGGLSMIGEGLPGVGPAVTIPAQYFLPDTPAFDKVREQIFPYGQPPNSPGGPVGDIAQSLVPPSVDKVLQGLMDTYHDQKAYNTTVGSMIRYLASTGDYDLRGKDAAAETNRMLSDAKDKAKWFYVIRGLAQSVSPSAPSPLYQVKDKTGHLTIVDKIVNDYRKVQTAKGPDAALDWLVKSYGMDNVFIAQPFSKPVVYGVPVTKEGHDWANAHSDVRGKYPNSYGFFAPQQGKFDITAFEDQFTRGERQSLTPEGIVKEGNNRIGMWLYHKQRDAILKSNGGDAPDSGQQDWLNNYRKALMDHFPGFNLVPYDDKRLPRTIGELEAAAKDPALKDQDATQGLRDYLQFRAQANQTAVNDYGYKTAMKARDAAPLRDWLRDLAAKIIKRHPDFAPMWEQVFSHELATDVKAANVQAAP